jgi:CMP-N-acetylneuraminic acid synthetase
MINRKKLLAIIPARGGSKRLPKKNILNLVNKPLIVWTIEAALDSKYIDKVIVSTDDKDIADISEQYGATIPFIRPSKLATDETPSIDVILHAADFFKKNDYDYVVLLQPTSPLRTSKHIDESIELLDAKNADAIISVCKMDHSPLWSNTLEKDGNMKGFLQDDILNKRSQDLDIYYRLNGAIYICNINKIKEERSFFLKDNIFAYKMNRKSSIDIDNEIDFKLAKVLLDSEI